jgi:hypothetical protein
MHTCSSDGGVNALRQLQSETQEEQDALSPSLAKHAASGIPCIQRVVDLSDCSGWGWIFAVNCRTILDRIFAPFNYRVYCLQKYFYRSFGFLHFDFAAVVCAGSRSTPLFDT